MLDAALHCTTCTVSIVSPALHLDSLYPDGSSSSQSHLLLHPLRLDHEAFLQHQTVMELYLLSYTALHNTALNYTVLYYHALNNTALHYTALNKPALHLYERHCSSEDSKPHGAVGDTDEHLELAVQAWGLVAKEALGGHHVAETHLGRWTHSV